MLLCATSVGCAGSRLSNLFSLNSTSDYKSIEELEAEAEKEAVLRERALAARVETDQEAENEASQTAMSGLLSRVLGRNKPQADPFLEMEMDKNAGSSTAEETHLAAIERRLAEEKRALEDLKKQQLAQAAKPSAKPSPNSEDLADFASVTDRFNTVSKTASQSTEDMFAELTKADSDADNAWEQQTKIKATSLTDKSNEAVFAALSEKAKLDKASSAADSDPVMQNPADALEALLAKSGHGVDQAERKARSMATDTLSRDAVSELDAFAVRELGLDVESNHEAAPLRAGRQTFGSSENAFDSLLAAAAPGASSTDNAPYTQSDQQLRKPARQPISGGQFQDLLADGGLQAPSMTGAGKNEAEDLFAGMSARQGAPLTDASGFNWKNVTKSPEPRSAHSWWNAASAEPAHNNSFGDAEDARHIPNRTSPFEEFENKTFAMPADNFSPPALSGLKPASDAGQLLQTPAIQTASLTRSSASSLSGAGFEADPLLATAASFASPADLEEAPQPPQAVNDTPVIKPGMMTGKTWVLLFGGLIVVFLLFTPSRNKQTQS